MRMRTVSALLLGAVALTSVPSFVGADEEICQAVSCYEQDGFFDWVANLVSSANLCDRVDGRCPRCLWVKSGDVLCKDPKRGKCEDDAVLCNARATPTPEPTEAPTPEPTPSSSTGSGIIDSDSEETDSSASGDGVAPSPTPAEDEDDATSSPSGTVRPSPTDTNGNSDEVSPLPTAEDLSNDVQKDTKSKEGQEGGMKIEVIAAIAVGALAVVAVLAFFIWKRNQDDEDSDDEDIPTYKPAAYTGAKSTTAATAATMSTAEKPAPTNSPRLGPAPYVSAKSGDYGSPSTIDASHRTGAAYAVDIDSDYESPRRGGNAMGEQNAWGSRIDDNDKSKRTLSNASVEF